MKVFNVLKRWLFVLVCSVSSLCAMEFAKKYNDAEEGTSASYSPPMVVAMPIENSMFFESYESNQNNDLLQAIDSHPDAEYLILLGNAGAGKTTLARLLTQEVVKPVMKNGEFRLAGDGISHSRNGSEKINYYFDESNNRMVLDFQGFADPRSKNNIKNTLLRKEVLDRLPEYKICFVVKNTDVMDRTTYFEEMLNRGYSFFPDQDLKESSYLVIMGGASFNRHERLSEIFYEFSATSDAHESNNLLQYFSENSSTKTCHFVKPDNLESYQDIGEVEVMWENLKSVTANKLKYVPVLDPKDEKLIRNQIEANTIEVTEFLRNVVSPSIQNAAYNKITSTQNDQGQEGALTAEQLKNEFKRAKLTLEEAIQSGVESLQKCLIEGGLAEDVIQSPHFNILFSLPKLSSLVNQPLSLSDMLRVEMNGAIDELDRLSTVETVDMIKSQGVQYEDGPFMLKETKTECQRRGFNKVDVKKEFWSKKLVANVVSQKITKFTPNLILMEPEISAIREYGETSQRERNGDSWR